MILKSRLYDVIRLIVIVSSNKGVYFIAPRIINWILLWSCTVVAGLETLYAEKGPEIKFRVIII